MILALFENLALDLFTKYNNFVKVCSILAENRTKAELLQEGIFFSFPFICQRCFSNEKVGNRKN